MDVYTGSSSRGIGRFKISTITPLVAIILATYGWWLINRLAKSREAHDLCSSAAVLLEQLAVDGSNAWKRNPPKLEDYTELQLVSKLAAVELRLNLIHNHYRIRGSPKESPVGKILELRRYLTITPDKLPDGENRNVAILRLTSDLVGDLLDQNYRYSARGRQNSRNAGFVVLMILVLIGLVAMALTSARSPYQHVAPCDNAGAKLDNPAYAATAHT